MYRKASFAMRQTLKHFLACVALAGLAVTLAPDVAHAVEAHRDLGRLLPGRGEVDERGEDRERDAAEESEAALPTVQRGL